jgi:hypothetical protein
MSTITRDDLLDAYMRGKRAAQDGAPPAGPEDGEELTLAQVYDKFNEASAGDVLVLRKHSPAELHQVLLAALDRGQFVYRVTYPDGWFAMVLTSHGNVAVKEDASHRISVYQPVVKVESGTLDNAVTIPESQAKYRADGKGWNLDTGAQFGRWFL